MDLTTLLILVALTAILTYACVMNAGADVPATAGAHGHGHDAHGHDAHGHDSPGHDADGGLHRARHRRSAAPVSAAATLERQRSGGVPARSTRVMRNA